MNEQMNLFHLMPQIKAGEYVTSHGKELEWKELERGIGKLVVVSCHEGESHILQVVELLQVQLNRYERKELLFSDCKGNIGHADKAAITRRKSPVTFYEI